MRELKYYVACTVDRFIAAEDGAFGAFLTHGAAGSGEKIARPF